MTNSPLAAPARLFPGLTMAVIALLFGCGAREQVRAATGVAPGVVAPPAALLRTPPDACLPGGEGQLRVRLRGAVNADIDWKDAQMICEGGTRPGDGGLRVSFQGPLTQSGTAAPRALRLVFGIDAPGVGTSVMATNVTAIIEGENLIFATQGDDKCSTERLERGDIEAAGDTSAPAAQRITARGFCTGPASALNGEARLLVTTFDFVGRIVLENDK